jgi:hypothetical protein
MSKAFAQTRPHLIPALVAALMLFGALGQWSYGYYQLLRFVVCGAGVFVAYAAYVYQTMWATWLFGFIAVLFNPFIPIHLTREMWQPVDLICGAFFLGKLKECGTFFATKKGTALPRAWRCSPGAP